MSENRQSWFNLCIYLAVGLLVYLLLYAPPDGVDWTNPWVYIVTLAWPFALAYEFIVIVLIVALAAVLIGVATYHLRPWVMDALSRRPRGEGRDNSDPK